MTTLKEKLRAAEDRAETAIRVAAEAMRIMTPEQVAELRRRLDKLEGKSDDGPAGGGNSQRPPG